MVKGVSRQVVLVRPKENADFEQAIFIMRSEHREVTEQQLLCQAEHAISRGSMRSWVQRAVFTLSGAAVGAGTVIVLVLLGFL